MWHGIIDFERRLYQKSNAANKVTNYFFNYKVTSLMISDHTMSQRDIFGNKINSTLILSKSYINQKNFLCNFALYRYADFDLIRMNKQI